MTRLKARQRGFGDRHGVPQLSWFSWYVVDCPMSAMWDGLHGHPLLPNNPLDQALALGRFKLKLRASSAGSAPTAMKTLGGFTPVTVQDNASLATATVGPYWRSDYLALYAEYQRLLAAKYDSVQSLQVVEMAEQGLVYPEPFRQYNLPALEAAGLTSSNYIASFIQVYAAHKVWKTTLQSMAFNPADIGGETVTEQQISVMRSVFGRQGVLGNDSLRAVDQGLAYDAMYAAIKAAGPPIYFQTSTMAKMGDPATTFQKAVDLGAESVELPSGYTGIDPTVLAKYQKLLEANP